MGEVSGIDCSASACPAACTCSLDKCASQVDACLADSTCAAAEDCVLKCACGDAFCLAACISANPSPLAAAAATCINTNCNGESIQSDFSGIDCSASACPAACTCSLDKCSSQVDACLADSTCVSAEDCVLKCACGDAFCLAGCVSANPSPLATAAATCI